MAINDPLLQPFTLKGRMFRNRILSTSHAISYGADGYPQDRYQLYHAEKAKGGLALTMFGGSSVISPDSASQFGQLDCSNDGIIPHFQSFAERIHAEGAYLMCQVTHMGRRTSHLGGNWLPPVSASRMPGDIFGGIPRAMDDADIARVVHDYGQAARRCYEGGLDGCEVIATGHLPDQFWTPRVNTRTDGYGGSLANRTRFSRMIFDEMRRQTPDDFIISLRMTMAEDMEGGLTRDDCLEIARLHAAEGTIDVLNLVHGAVDTVKALAAYMPGMAAGLSPFMHMAGEFRSETGLPVFHATRINDLATARAALRDGHVDMVGMTRAHIADPHIVAKLHAGMEERIRPCVGATYCSNYRQCIHNAATGREANMPHAVAPAEKPAKRAVVVGGGPAGLEAARVLALRGHDVALLEAADRLGGQVTLAAKAGWRRDLGGVTDWLAGEVEALGVDVHLNTYAEAEDVAARDPDIVIVATGGIPDTGWIAGDVDALSTWDVLARTEPLQGSVLIYDASGQAQAITAADHLANAGADVELVSRERMVGQNVLKLDAPTYLKHLYKAGARITPDHEFAHAGREGNRIRVTLRNHYSEIEEVRIVDHLIIERGTLPNDTLWEALAPGARNNGLTDVDAMAAHRPQEDPGGEGPLVYRIGDALASRDIHAAIYDALRLCKDL
ncbi:MAG: FAD-dependent oxidoreductase [Paracoccaceae bacterium]